MKAMLIATMTLVSAVAAGEPLAARALEPLPLGSIKPQGWLLNQLKIHASGLSGHLDEFWPDIRDSGWIGGKAEGWERAPYWLDGFVPLAYLLDDAALKAKAVRWMDYILTHQQPDGWLGPLSSKGYKKMDPWPTFVILKAMTQYCEATQDPRVIPAMVKCCVRLRDLLKTQPLFEWGKFRWMDLVVSVHWLLDQGAADPALYELADLAHAQGFDWRDHYENFKYPERVTKDFSLATHVVNNAMLVKAGPVWYRQSRAEADRDSIYRALDVLDKYHGQVTGIFAGDEHFAGKSPSQGSELCSVCEWMFSLETALTVLKDGALADRLERIAFNALPGTFSSDMWSHQYDQQANQVMCVVDKDRPFATNGEYANIFGLEPNYGCCTANLSQGWPKLASHLWYKTPDGGLAALAYAPCSITTTLGGKPVVVEVETDYPFNETVLIKVTADAQFPLHLRIPGWAEGAEVKVADEAVPATPGQFCVVDREWSGTTALALRFPMKARVERRFRDSVSVLRGPLVFSLKIGEEWKKIAGEEPHADYEVRPTTPWNYGLVLDTAHPEASVQFETKAMSDCPFSPDGAPVVAKAKGKIIPEWGIEHHAAGILPQSPVKSAEPEVALTLIPYGSAKLRISELPVLE